MTVKVEYIDGPRVGQTELLPGDDYPPGISGREDQVGHYVYSSVGPGVGRYHWVDGPSGSLSDGRGLAQRRHRAAAMTPPALRRTVFAGPGPSIGLSGVHGYPRSRVLATDLQGAERVGPAMMAAERAS